MYNSQALASREFAIRQRIMHDFNSEGTGSVIVGNMSDPYQSVLRTWGLLSPAAPNLREVHSATTGACLVVVRNQIDLQETLTSDFNFEFEAVPSPIAYSPASVLDMVRAVFSLNISETAEVFGITRQTAYQWMNLTEMDQVRSHENRERLKQLYNAVQLWKENPPLKGRWLYALLPSGNTVLDLLKTPQVDFDALKVAYRALAASTMERRREEGERATQAAATLVEAFSGLGAGRKARKG